MTWFPPDFMQYLPEDIKEKFPFDTDIDLKVEDVKFLTPARVALTVNGYQVEVMVSVDLMNRLVYDSEGQVHPVSDLIFEHLDKTNYLPEDFFQASPEVYEKVLEVQEEHRNMKGDFNGG